MSRLFAFCQSVARQFLNSREAKKRLASRRRRSFFESLEDRRVMTGTPLDSGIGKFDFGTTTSVVATDYQRVSRLTTYDPGTGASFGWVTSPESGNFDADQADPLKRDFVRGNLPNSFLADLPYGTYDVVLTAGSWVNGQTDTQVTLEGTVVDTFSTTPQNYHVATYASQLIDGQLTLDLEDIGPDVSDLWRINGLAATPSSLQMNRTGGAITYTEKDPLTPLLPNNATVLTPGGKFNGGSLTISGATSVNDRLEFAATGTGPGQISVDTTTKVLSFAGQPIATYTGGSGTTALSITFNAAGSGDVTSEAVMALVRTIGFRNVNQLNLAPGSRNLVWTLSDGSGNTGITKTVTVNVINDSPTISQPSGPVTYTEDAPPIAILPGVTVSDPDSAHLNGGSLVVAITAGGGTNDRLAITNQGTAAGQIGVSGTTVTYGGLVIGTVTNNNAADPANHPLVVSFTTTNATPAAAQALVRAITFENVNHANPLTNDRTVTFTISDSAGGTSRAQTVHLVEQNDAPTISASFADATINEDTALAPISFTIGDVDTPLANLQLSATSSDPALLPPGSFVFSGTGASRTLTVTPAANQSGVATITVTVSDGTGTPNATATRSFQLTVNAVNDAPVNTVPGSQEVNEDTLLVFSSAHGNAVSISDVDAASSPVQVTLSVANGTLTLPSTTGLTFSIGNGTANSTMTFTGSVAAINAALNGLSYLPNLNYNGSDTLTITTNDLGNSGAGGALSDSDSVVLTVASVNDLPTISPIADQPIDEDGTTGALSFTVGDVETAAGSLTVTAVSDNLALVPLSGIVLGGSGANRTVTVTPAADQFGDATITLTVTDADGGSTPLSFTLHVQAVDDAPTVPPIATAHVNEDDSTVIGFTVDDVDTPLANLQITATSSDPILVPNGNIVLGGSGANRTLTITPAANQFGDTTITVAVFDGVNTTTRSFLLQVQAVDDAPTVSVIANATTNEDEPTAPIAFTLDDIDTPLANLQVTATSSNLALVPNANIMLGGSGASRTLTITPAANQFGDTTITVAVFDGVNTTTRSFTLHVEAVNDPPVAVVDPDYSTDEDTPLNATRLSLLGNDYDPEGATLTWEVVAGFGPLHGQVIVNSDESFTYIPDSNYNGPDSFMYRVFDGELWSEPVTVTVHVNAVNDRPSPGASSFSFEAEGGVTLSVAAPGLLDGATDVDGQPLQVILVDGPVHGQLQFDKDTGSFNYTPQDNYDGTDSFTYRITDLEDESDLVTVSFSVTSPDEEPGIGTVVGSVRGSTSGTWYNLMMTTDQLTAVEGSGQSVNAKFWLEPPMVSTDSIYVDVYAEELGTGTEFATKQTNMEVGDFTDPYTPQPYFSDQVPVLEFPVGIIADGYNDEPEETFGYRVEGRGYEPVVEGEPWEVVKQAEQQFVAKIISPLYDMQTPKVYDNEFGDVLTEEEEDSAGAYLPVNDDVDLYRDYRDANGQVIKEYKLGGGGGDFGDELTEANLPNFWAHDNVWPEWVSIPEENDLLPIYVPRDQDATYTLTIPSNLRVWQNADRTGLIISDNGQNAPAPTVISGGGDAANQVLYVEGRSQGTGTIALNVEMHFPLFTVPIRGIDSIKFTTFTWQGPQNVPGASIYGYSASGVAEGVDSKWISPVGGTLQQDYSEVDANYRATDYGDILWDAGPTVGHALYQAHPNYTWGLNVNVVNVSVSAPSGQDAFVEGTPVDGGPTNALTSTFKGVKSADFPQSLGLDWKASVTLTGPDSNRGVSFIVAGFTQAVTSVNLAGFYADTSTGTWQDFSNEWLEKLPARDTVDFDLEFPDAEDQRRIRDLPGFSPLWYSKKDASVFWAPSATANVKTIESHDTPTTGAPLTYDHGVGIQDGDDVVDLIEAEIHFQLDVSARTVDVRHGGNYLDMLTRQWTVLWNVNLSGSIIAQDGSYIWVADEEAGVYVTGGWVRATAGDRPVDTFPANTVLTPTLDDFKDR